MTDKREAVVAELMLEVSCLRDETEALRNKVAMLEAERNAAQATRRHVTDDYVALQKLAGEMAEAIRDSGFTGTYKKVDCLRKYRTLNPVPDSGK